MLLHKIEAWNTVELLYAISQFSPVQVFKPEKKHGIRSSFYLIARKVQPNTEAAILTIASWKRAWWHATFGGENGTGGTSDIQTKTIFGFYSIDLGVSSLNWAGPYGKPKQMH